MSTLRKYLINEVDLETQWPSLIKKLDDTVKSWKTFFKVFEVTMRKTKDPEDQKEMGYLYEEEISMIKENLEELQNKMKSHRNFSF
jgi:hypothetical protein